MILYVDSENKVRAVNSTTDTSLTPLYVDENNEQFPFKGWSIAKICCYMVNVTDGVVTMWTPYVDSRMLESIDAMGHSLESAMPYKVTKTAYIDDTEVVFNNVPYGAISVALSNPSIDFTVTYDSGNVVVEFAPLEEVTKVTLTIN